MNARLRGPLRRLVKGPATTAGAARGRLRGLSIRHKLVLLVAVTTVAALVILGVPLTLHQVHQYRQRAGEALEAQARLMAAQSGAALAFSDTSAAQRILGSLEKTPQVVAASIYLADGTPFARYVRPGGAPACPARNILVQGGHEYRQGCLFASRPVKVDGEVLGTLAIAARPLGVEAVVRRQVYLAVSLVLLAAVGVVVASRRLRRLVSEPLIQLVNHMHAVSASQDYSRRAAVKSADEIGALSAAFNEMLEQIQRRDRDLLVHQGQLESEVEARTAELQEELDRRARNEAELRLAASVFDSSAEGIFITDPEERILRVNRAFTRITGYTAEEVVGQTPRLLRSGLHNTEFYQMMWEGLQASDHWEGEVTNRAKGGETFTEWLNISAVRSEGGAVSHYVGIFHDITEKKAAEERIFRLAHYDALTGLANRRLFAERLDHALKVARRKGQYGALLYIDLDQFKPVNDNLGHEAGDALLRELGERLQGQVRETDTAARLGGDEFAVLLEDVDARQAGRIAEKLLHTVAKPFLLDGQDVRVGASIGIATYPENGREAEALLAHGDIAMYAAKDAGRNNYRYFASEMNQSAGARFRVQAGLRRALEQGEFALHYQPQVELSTGRVIGLEALLRWEDAERGQLSPAEFLDVAEESGLIIPIGQWVFDEACRQRAAWASTAPTGLHVAVNVSAKQFHTGDIARRVQHVLSATGVAPHQIQVELTESTLMRNLDAAQRELQELDDLGVSIALDDFGTGYSSLSYLKRLPIRTLKVDRSFTLDVPHEPNGTAIVKAVIGMARSLDIEVIAEGVETEEQLRFLWDEGCESVQGYYYSPPLTADEALLYVLQGHPSSHERPSPGCRRAGEE